MYAACVDGAEQARSSSNQKLGYPLLLLLHTCIRVLESRWGPNFNTLLYQFISNNRPKGLLLVLHPFGLFTFLYERGVRRSRILYSDIFLDKAAS